MARYSPKDEIIRLDYNSFLKYCKDEEVNFLQESQSKLQLKKGQLLFQENSNLLGVYILKSGKIKLYKTIAGKDHILEFCGKDQMVGYVSLIGGTRHHRTAEALEESELIILPKANFLQVVENNFTVKELIAEVIARQSIYTEEHLLKLLYKPLRSRLSEVLLQLSDEFQDDIENNDAQGIFNRENLAALTGVTRETVIRVLSDFKKEGLIETRNKHINILDNKELIKISQSL